MFPLSLINLIYPVSTEQECFIVNKQRDKMVEASLVSAIAQVITNFLRNFQDERTETLTIDAWLKMVNMLLNKTNRISGSKP